MEDFSYSMGRADHLRRDHRSGLLVIADRIDATDLTPVADAAGLRLLGVAPLADASARLDGQLQCDVLLLFCPASTPALESLLAQVEAQAVRQGMAVILVAGWETIDLAFAAAQGSHTQLLCDPDHSDLAAALVTAGEERPAPGQVHDRDGDSSRLEQLSAEVSRLARTLDALTQRSHFAAPSFDPGPRIADRPSDYIGMPALAPMGTATPPAYVPTPTLSATQVRDLLRARRIRADFLPGDLFADPAWDMLLDLLAARLEQERVSVSSLCIAAAVPPTTALRWIRTLTAKGLVERQADPQDGRRIFIALAQDAADAMIRWFSASRRLLAS